MLQELLDNIGLARVSSVLTNAALPSIRLITQSTDDIFLVSGKSKFGGHPDLPQTYTWPDYQRSPLPFIAQINLSDILSYDIKHYLPPTGMLYFFFDLNAFFTHFHDETWRVLYHATSITQSEQIIPQESKLQYRRCMIDCTTELTLPNYSPFDGFDSMLTQQFELPKKLTELEERAYYQVLQQLSGTVDAKNHIPIHRLFGYSDNVQWDIYRELGGVSTNWQLLFQMDSDSAPDTNWGDTGRIYFWITKQDLAKRDFSKVRLILQST